LSLALSMLYLHCKWYELRNDILVRQMAKPTSSDVQRDEADKLYGANHLVVIILNFRY
jgi:hypothetical protein